MKKGLYLILSTRTFVRVYLVFLVLIFSVVALTTQKAIKTNATVSSVKPVIIIDAGHGGEDGGTQSADGVLEKDINLAISQKIKKILTRYGFDTVMIRDSDRMIYDEDSSTVRSKKSSDLHNRMNVMKAHPESVFLSIHQNHFSESKYTGAQVFYCKSQTGSAELAESIQKSIVSDLQKDNTRQIKPCTSSVYLIHDAVTTAVMVECGFLSNKAEAEKLADNTYQCEMALAISKGLVNYLHQKEADNYGSEN